MPPERLIKAERHDDRWNTAPQCGPGCSCSAVVNNRGHPRKEPVMGNAVYKEHVLGMLHRAIQRTPACSSKNRKAACRAGMIDVGSACGTGKRSSACRCSAVSL